MQTYMTISTLGVIGGLLLFLALGAVCGSFINVLVYRMPRGQSVVSPPSACPACGTTLTWRENFPIFGWLWLRARCRFCRSKVSPEYPLVELAVALLFAAFYLWFADPQVMSRVGMDIRAWRPEWAAAGIWQMWPMLLVILCLVTTFVAATLIDARTFLIPIALPWFATGVALVIHPLHALWVQLSLGGLRGPNFDWTIPTVTGSWLGAALGGGLGIAISAALLAAGLLPRSFADYEEWERQAQDAPTPEPDTPTAAGSGREDVRLTIRRALFLTGPAVALMFVGFSIGLRAGLAIQGMLVGLGLGLLIGLLLRRVADRATDEEPSFLQYPHARREMGKELLFLAPAVVLAVAGFWACGAGGPAELMAAAPPLWLKALGGSVLGYLVAGGIVWFTRIGGTLAVNAEAMGIGDVHLLAAAGAALGWIDPVLAFFTAPFFGLLWAALSALSRRFFKLSGTALPYGPHLAIATICVLLGKPLYEMLLSWVTGEPVNIP